MVQFPEDSISILYFIKFLTTLVCAALTKNIPYAFCQYEKEELKPYIFLKFHLGKFYRRYRCRMHQTFIEITMISKNNSGGIVCVGYALHKKAR